jgi:hypothetical protein
VNDEENEIDRIYEIKKILVHIQKEIKEILTISQIDPVDHAKLVKEIEMADNIIERLERL